MNPRYGSGEADHTYSLRGAQRSGMRSGGKVAQSHGKLTSLKKIFQESF